jgi:hypothetical protein
MANKSARRAMIKANELEGDEFCLLDPEAFTIPIFYSPKDARHLIKNHLCTSTISKNAWHLVKKEGRGSYPPALFNKV